MRWKIKYWFSSWDDLFVFKNIIFKIIFVFKNVLRLKIGYRNCCFYVENLDFLLVLVYKL